MTIPSRVEVLDPVDRWLHLGAAAGGVGALLSGPLARFPGVAEGIGLDPGGAGFLHGAFAAVALAAWGLHLVRICLAWLDGRNPWGLLPRPTDARGLWQELQTGQRAVSGRYSYRERTPYGVFQAALPLLCLTGWAVSHPGPATRLIGAEGLLEASSAHVATALLTVPFVLWHVYFAHVQPAALYWNASWLTGTMPWARFEAMWPEWARQVAAQVRPGEHDEPEAPSVQSLLEEGNRAVGEGHYAQGERAYEEALRLYPGYSQALYNLGVARARGGKTTAAVEALERFLEQDPFSPVAPRARELLSRLRREELA